MDFLDNRVNSISGGDNDCGVCTTLGPYSAPNAAFFSLNSGLYLLTSPGDLYSYTNSFTFVNSRTNTFTIGPVLFGFDDYVVFGAGADAPFTTFSNLIQLYSVRDQVWNPPGSGFPQNLPTARAYMGSAAVRYSSTTWDLVLAGGENPSMSLFCVFGFSFLILVTLFF
jgi:hypothetical protein